MSFGIPWAQFLLYCGDGTRWFKKGFSWFHATANTVSYSSPLSPFHPEGSCCFSIFSSHLLLDLFFMEWCSDMKEHRFHKNLRSLLVWGKKKINFLREWRVNPIWQERALCKQNIKHVKTGEREKTENWRRKMLEFR